MEREKLAALELVTETPKRRTSRTPEKAAVDFRSRSSDDLRSTAQQNSENGCPLFLAHQRIAAVRAGKGHDERATPARPCLRCRPLKKGSPEETEKNTR
jgi:hypothetical protein